MKKDVHISGGAQKNNFPKHHALATDKQNKQGVLPGGSCCKGKMAVKGHK